MENKKLDPRGNVAVPAFMIPSFMVSVAIERGVENKILFKSYGGLGDIICSIPTVEYALKMFPQASIYLASERPEFFSHLKFKKVFDLKEEFPVWENYLVLPLIQEPTHLLWQFVSHMITNCVDFPTISALRSTLPIKEKELYMKPPAPKKETLELLEGKKVCYVHPGAHWKSKTLPKDYWDSIIQGLVLKGITPVLLGGKLDDNRGTVDVDANGCLDLRGQISFTDTVWLLQRAKVLISNDSFPIHAAATKDPDDTTTGHCWIGLFATAKHYDFISHWRYGEWQYRTHNFSKGYIGDVISHLPNQDKEVSAEFVDEEILRSWLPDPQEVITFAIDKI